MEYHRRKFKFLHYAGGSYIVGASQLIIDGHIKAKQGTVARINPHSLLLDDGTELPADEIIWATGSTSMLDMTRKIMATYSANQLKEVWGLDEEGELR
ncbi:hypothetical protein GJ744_011794 [Endocarpon pusillum]|uniref:FAD/NAD(P)-binding domain-containing protein n=1 Tax=Endocarpon pusillum TaxID=364733 RepID=A0A8H7E2L2_9EURO|nr:hypothetical protein GJ744_011794 [Endocarpon pusillum]